MLLVCFVQGCSENSAESLSPKENRYSEYKSLWVHETAYFGTGRWGKTEDLVCFWNRDDSTIDVLNRHTGAIVHRIPMPSEAIHGGNAPLLIKGSKLYIFSESSEQSRVVDLRTGTVTLSKERNLGMIKPFESTKILIVAGQISFEDTATGNKWIQPFHMEGFTLLSHALGIAAEKNVYAHTQIYEGKLRATDLLPGGGVTGKPVGFSLKAYGRKDGALLWHLPQEKRLSFCEETVA